MYSKLLNLIMLALVLSPFRINAESKYQKYLNDSLPEQWTYVSNFVQTNPIEDAWWRSFNDNTLDSLISLGVQNNYNLLMARKRIEMARAAIGKSRSYYMPTFETSFGWIKNRSAGDLNNESIKPINSDYFSLGVNMSWQIDLFGQISEQVKVSKANWQATKSQYDAAMVTLCGNIATAYIDLRMYQREYEVAIQHATSQKIITELANTRYKTGLASKLDVSQSLMVYYATLASIPSLSAGIENTINTIAILIGVYPSEIKGKLDKVQKLPDYAQIVGVGIPMELLRRRPDILEAENNLASAVASLGVSKKEFLPILNITGNIGLESHKINNLFIDKAFTYTISPKLTWTIFDGLKRKYNVVSARENLQLEIDNYNYTVMTAYQDVEEAMINYKYSVISIDKINQAMNEAQTALVLSVELYKKGLTEFTNVMSAQMSFLQYNISLIQAKGKALISLINLYEALGGGWNVVE